MPHTTSPSGGGNEMSSYTSTHSQAFQNLDADPVSVQTIVLISTLSLTPDLGTPSPHHVTCATITTRAIPVHAPPTDTSTSATTLDVQGPTPAKSTTGSPAKRIGLNCLRALAVPPEAIPKYLSLLKPPTPINIPTL